MSRTNKLMMNRLRDLREERDLKQKGATSRWTFFSFKNDFF